MGTLGANVAEGLRQGTAGRHASLIVTLGAVALLATGCIVTPEPLTVAERTKEAEADRAAMFANQEPIKGPISLEEAFARALKYNLDRRVKLMEEAVSQDQLDVSRYDLLPQLVASAGYLNRSNQEASSSRSVTTGLQSLEPSTSSDRDRVVTDLTLSWNILDFGVSYFAAHQQANRALIVTERRRKVVQNLFQDVRSAFWRVASAQALSEEIQNTIKEAESALADSRLMEAERLRSPLDALRYQRTLLDLLRQLEALREQLQVSKAQLASLINLPPGEDFTVQAPEPKDFPPTKFLMPMREMEIAALVQNPDVRELSYESRISVEETDKAILRMLPGITLSFGYNYDSNSFLVNNAWRAGAARLTWNIFNLLSGPANILAAEDSEKVAATRRQAVSMAVLTKVHIAEEEYRYSEQQYERYKAIAKVDEKIYEQVSNRVASDAQGVLERVTSDVSNVTSRLRLYQSYADMQAALGHIYSTIGVDPTPKSVAALDVENLTREIKGVMTKWQDGQFDVDISDGRDGGQHKDANVEASVARADGSADKPTQTKQ